MMGRGVVNSYWPKVDIIVEIHDKFHQAMCNGLRVITLTEK